MRDLILVRGAPGSGKSTWVAANKLQPYCLSSDAVRMMFSCPELDPNTGEPHITQRHDKQVWDFIAQDLELRMQNGQFIVFDAQNINPSDWIKLAEKYRYRVWVKEINATLDECLERNAKRPSLNKVPEQVIMSSIDRLESIKLPSSVKPVPDDVVSGDLAPLNVDEYKRIFFAGDIHGCIEPLKDFYEYTNHFQASDLIVFVGDFVDRGLNNREVLELLIQYKDAPNVIFLEGNHTWELKWAADDLDAIHSPEFRNNTMPQLEGMDKKALREWGRRWRQMAYLEYHGKRYFVTHAGFGFMPEHIRFVPTKMYTRGGSYEDDVDRWWCEKCYGDTLIQVHGHRNSYGYAIDETETSINLCSSVEFGEPWRVYGTDGEDTYYMTFDNPVHRAGMTWARRAEIFSGKLSSKLTEPEKVELLVGQLRDAHSAIVEKQLKYGISSFNFSRDVFHSMAWDDLSKVARGLFINTQHYKIIARGFEKFFGVDERGINDKQYLKEHLVFPVKAWKKYNGFLLMTSWDPYTNSVFCASKSTDSGPHVSIGQSVLGSYFKDNPEDMKSIINLMKDEDATILWEICSSADPHIIKEWDDGISKDNKAVCLAIVKNTVKFEELPEDRFVALTCECWEACHSTDVEAVFDTWEELEPCLDSGICAPVYYPTEGWVLRDANGYRIKIKTAYYQKWKRLRNIKHAIEDNPELVVNTDNMDDTAKSVVQYMQTLPNELLWMKSIIDIRDEWTALGNQDYPYDLKLN